MVEKDSSYERWDMPNIGVDGVFYIENKPATAKQIEEIRKSAYEEGLEQGKTAGFEAGFAKGDQEIKAAIASLGQVLQTLQEPLQSEQCLVEKNVTELVRVLTKQVLKQEMAINPALLMDVVIQAITCLPGSKNTIKVLVNPDDYDLMSLDLQEQGIWKEDWQILSDQRISRGGCLVESAESIVDASLEKQCEELINQVYVDITKPIIYGEDETLEAPSDVISNDAADNIDGIEAHQDNDSSLS